MPHSPRPFYKSKRRTWYVQLGNTQHSLGRHPSGLPEPKKGRDGLWSPPPEILRAFHEKMTEDPQDQPPTRSAPEGEHPFVVSILDQYLDWLSKRVQEGTKARRTYDWYVRYLQDFVKFATREYRVADLTVDQLAPIHVYQWVDSHPDWKTGKRGAMITVQRPFTWAAKAGLLRSVGGRSPLAGLEKPAQGRREQLVTEAEYQAILEVLTCPEARDLIETAWETGMRPAELFSFEAAFFEDAAGRIVFPIRLSKGKKVQRVVYLNERALEIVRRRVRRFPGGPILRNSNDVPWCMSATNNLFQRVRDSLGRKRVAELGLMPPRIPRLKAEQRSDKQARAEHARKLQARSEEVRRLAREHGTKYSLYAMRHAFCTEALENGLDAVTVSVLMGHRDTTMISRVYSHIDQRQEHLRAAANKARAS